MICMRSSPPLSISSLPEYLPLAETCSSAITSRSSTVVLEARLLEAFVLSCPDAHDPSLPELHGASCFSFQHQRSVCRCSSLPVRDARVQNFFSVHVVLTLPSTSYVNFPSPLQACITMHSLHWIACITPHILDSTSLTSCPTVQIVIYICNTDISYQPSRPLPPSTDSSSIPLPATSQTHTHTQ